MDREFITTKMERRGRFTAIPARNRFLKLSEAEMKRGLELQSNFAHDCCIGPSWDLPKAAVFAEAAAHWAFMLHPELRPADDAFWAGPQAEDMI